MRQEFVVLDIETNGKELSEEILQISATKFNLEFNGRSIQMNNKESKTVYYYSPSNIYAKWSEEFIESKRKYDNKSHKVFNRYERKVWENWINNASIIGHNVQFDIERIDLKPNAVFDTMSLYPTKIKLSKLAVRMGVIKSKLKREFLTSLKHFNYTIDKLINSDDEELLQHENAINLLKIKGAHEYQQLVFEKNLQQDSKLGFHNAIKDVEVTLKIFLQALRNKNLKAIEFAFRNSQAVINSDYRQVAKFVFPIKTTYLTNRHFDFLTALNIRDSVERLRVYIEDANRDLTFFKSGDLILGKKAFKRKGKVLWGESVMPKGEFKEFVLRNTRW